MPNLDELLRGMLEEEGSDLHIMVGQPPRIRVHGDLAPLDLPPLEAETVASVLRAICPPEKWREYTQHNDVDFAYELPGAARFRCNYLRNYHGMAAVFRVIPSHIASIEDLGLPDVLKRIAGSRAGLVLVTGPTGSGKSTTLAAMIDYINRHFRRKIITVEDPVEFMHSSRKSIILHREVGIHTDTFSEALRSAMRANPDILLVGELRDLETIRLALNCAAMGMVVFGTLHTNSAPKTVDRIIDAFPADEQPHIRMLLAEALEAVVSQLLCRRIGKPPGRVAVHEILLRTEGLPNSIREGHIANLRSLIDGGGGAGMVSMDGSLLRLLEDGAIAPTEAYRNAHDKDTFRPYLPVGETGGSSQENARNS